MHPARFAWVIHLFLLGIALFPTGLSAQVALWPPVPPYSNLVTNPVRDPKAVEVVQAAIAALGGAQVISQIQSWQVQAQTQDTIQNSTTTGKVTWEKAGKEFRMQSLTPSGTYAVVTGNGKPASIANGTPKTLQEHVTRALFVPPLVGDLLLRQIQDQNYSIQYGGTTTLGRCPRFRWRWAAV
jgi:hypothetical protein